jgi:hypothetical protein
MKTKKAAQHSSKKVQKKKNDLKEQTKIKIIFALGVLFAIILAGFSLYTYNQSQEDAKASEWYNFYISGNGKHICVEGTLQYYDGFSIDWNEHPNVGLPVANNANNGYYCLPNQSGAATAYLVRNGNVIASKHFRSEGSPYNTLPPGHYGPTLSITYGISGNQVCAHNIQQGYTVQANIDGTNIIHSAVSPGNGSSVCFPNQQGSFHFTVYDTNGGWVHNGTVW